MVVALTVAGCGGGSPIAPRGGVAVDEPLPRPSIEVHTLRVRETDDGSLLEVEANAPLIWTSYRNAGGDFVLELVDAVPGPGVVDLAPAEGLIEQVAVEVPDMLRQSNAGNQAPTKKMTRLTVLTRTPSVHALHSEAQTLSLTFTPVAGDAVPGSVPARRAASHDDRRATAGRASGAPSVPTPITAPRPVAEPAIESESLDDEPLAVAPPPAPIQRPTPIEAPPPATEPRPTPPPPAAETRPAPPQPAPDPRPEPREPRPAPPPPAPDRVDGPPAGRLLGARVDRGPYGPIIRLEADGQLEPRPFRLSSPARFVIDFSGVVLDADRREIEIDTGGVTSLRLGQFQRQPAIARVVLDLDDPAVEPRLEPVAGGLIVHLGDR